MKNNIKLICLCGITLFLLGVFFHSTNVSAAYALHKKYSNTYLFAVPEGGWSSISVNINYTERYTKYDSVTNKFYSREYVFAYKCAYATSKPGGNVVAIRHYTKLGDELHHFTNWSNLEVIVPTGYDFVSSKKNGTNKFYSTNTESYAHMAFQVTCNGAVPPVHTDSFKLVLTAK